MKFITEAKAPLYGISSVTDEGRNYYIEGVFMQGDILNGNDRIYPLNVLESAAEVYRREWINTGSATAELDHPENPTVNLKAVSHRILSLEQQGKEFIGKALILDTDQGRQVKALLNGGVRLGVSTRGLASVIEDGKTSIVQPDFILTAVDIVSNPSAPAAFVKGLMEGKEWICESGVFRCKDIDSLRKTIKQSKDPLKEKSLLKSLERFLGHLSKAK